MKRNERIAVLQLLPDYGNSIAHVCNEYTGSLDRNRFHVTVAYLTGEPDSAVVDQTQADQVLFFKLQLSGLRLKAIRQLWHHCQQHPYQVVVCHRYKAASIMAWVALLLPIPYLFFVVHGIDYLRTPGRKLFAWLLLQRRFTFIAVSKAVQQNLLATQYRLPPERVRLIYNSLNESNVRKRQLTYQQAREQLGLVTDVFVFATVGRLVRFKRQDILLKAFAQIHNVLADAQLVVIGAGPEEQRLKQLVVDLGIETKVCFTGAIFQAERLYRAFDVFVLPSDNEPFGLVLLEAMAAACPIIATDSGAAPEILADCAVLVPTNQPQALAQAMTNCYQLSIEQRQQLGQAGQDRLQQHFATSQFVNLLEQLFATQSS